MNRLQQGAVPKYWAHEQGDFSILFRLRDEVEG